MTVTVERAGLQTLVQAEPRVGSRHLGVPASGAADPLSLALANRLVSNPLNAPALEAALVGPVLVFDARCAFALTGASARATLDGEPVAAHRTVLAEAGAVLEIGAAEAGARMYVSFAGGIDAKAVLGSASTYAPAGLGGLAGRPLRDGDVIPLAGASADVDVVETPTDYRLPMMHNRALRVCASAETGQLGEHRRSVLFDTTWTVGRRADRMGVTLEGATIDIDHDGRMPSAPVFPGTIQCPNDGMPYLLGVDAGTTGGYPRIGQVARLDRHLIGQLRPGDHVRLLFREPGDAVAELKSKHAYWRRWLAGIEDLV